jgi:RNA polymerase sigma-70 factor (ECF subfamily)
MASPPRELGRSEPGPYGDCPINRGRRMRRPYYLSPVTCNLSPDPCPLSPAHCFPLRAARICALHERRRGVGRLCNMEMTFATRAVVAREDRSTEASGELSEEVLVERSAAGDELAYGMLVRRYQARLFNFIRSMLRNEELAEDITQESFIKAFYSLSKLNNPASFKSWLFRIANNNTLDYLRKKRLPQVDVDEHLRESYVDDRGNPEEGVVSGARTRHIQEALGSLKKDQRAILVMCDLEGLSYQEIAEVLKIPFGTVQSRIFYARRKLREHLNTSIVFGGKD